jgi:hypothetical protein
MARRLEGNIRVLNPCNVALTTGESTAAFAQELWRAKGANRENGVVLNLCVLCLLAARVGVTSC